MAALTADRTIGESSYGSVGPGQALAIRVSASATPVEYYVGQALVLDSGRLVPAVAASTGKMYAVCDERYTSKGAADTKRIRAIRGAQYWMDYESLAVVGNVGDLLFLNDTDNPADDLQTAGAVGTHVLFGKILMIEDNKRILVSTEPAEQVE